ncbi:MAG: hypothetical protein M3529_00580 [Actinomycetota bacterium]|nr:hypothetical protein [Actinomycetota bacterium]
MTEPSLDWFDLGVLGLPLPASPLPAELLLGVLLVAASSLAPAEQAEMSHTAGKAIARIVVAAR